MTREESCGFVQNPSMTIEQVKTLCEEMVPRGFIVRDSVPDDGELDGAAGITIVAPKGRAVIYWEHRDEQHGFWIASLTDNDGNWSEKGHASDVERVISQAIELL